MDILHLDNHLLIVAKPAGLLSQSDETGDPDLLSLGKAYLKRRFDKPGAVYLGLVHRLDRPASGAMVLARTSKAAARLSAQFRERTVEKRYLAIVEGALTGGETWTDYIAKQDGSPRLVAASHPKAKRAALAWRTLAVERGCALVDIDLHTGRAHQIRLQFAHRGFPLLGDLRYGAAHTFDGRCLALHGYLLAIDHPTKRERLTWRLPPPASWRDWFAGERHALFGAPTSQTRGGQTI